MLWATVVHLRVTYDVVRNPETEDILTTMLGLLVVGVGYLVKPSAAWLVLGEVSYDSFNWC